MRMQTTELYKLILLLNELKSIRRVLTQAERHSQAKGKRDKRLADVTKKCTYNADHTAAVSVKRQGYGSIMK